MRKAFKYRLQPSKGQRTKLLQTLELCRWVYNETLAARKNNWEQAGQTLSLYQANKLLTMWKSDHPELKGVFSQVLQNAQERVDLAFKAFFRRVKANENPGYPRFRGYGRYDSFTFKQFGFAILEAGTAPQHKLGRLSLSKIGVIKIILHRPIEGQIKTLTIQRNRVGNWYACFNCEVHSEPLPFSALAIGIDMGLESFAKFSNGQEINNPRFFRTDEKELAKVQRKLSKADAWPSTGRGTLDRAKRLKAIQHIHQRIANRRKDFAHKKSRELVNNFGFLAFEDLPIKKMIQNHFLAKSILDAAWNQLITYTAYKAENAGRVIVFVDPRNTSMQCSRCGTLVEKSLSVRVHICPVCGLVMNRDQNAAINILGLGLQSLGMALEAPAFTRGE